MKHTKAKNIKKAYEVYKCTRNTYSLYDVYRSASCEKGRAFHYCMEKYREFDGRNPRIIGHNSFSFSFGFIGLYNDQLTFFYITKDNDFYIHLHEME